MELYFFHWGKCHIIYSMILSTQHAWWSQTSYYNTILVGFQWFQRWSGHCWVNFGPPGFSTAWGWNRQRWPFWCATSIWRFDPKDLGLLRPLESDLRKILLQSIHDLVKFKFNWIRFLKAVIRYWGSWAIPWLWPLRIITPRISFRVTRMGTLPVLHGVARRKLCWNITLNSSLESTKSWYIRWTPLYIKSYIIMCCSCVCGRIQC